MQLKKANVRLINISVWLAYKRNYVHPQKVAQHCCHA